MARLSADCRERLTVTRINASCTVDMLRFGPIPLWEVVVTDDSGDHVRTYQIDAKTDDKAAQQGLEMFVEEIGNMRDIAEVGLG